MPYVPNPIFAARGVEARAAADQVVDRITARVEAQRDRHVKNAEFAASMFGGHEQLLTERAAVDALDHVLTILKEFK